MNNTESLPALKLALALRKKKKALTLRLAIAKAQSMESAYGADLATDLWKAVGEAEKAVKLNTPKAE